MLRALPVATILQNQNPAPNTFVPRKDTVLIPLSPTEAFASGTACLTGDAAHHLGRVLRAEPGQLYELSDANSVFLARVERVSGNRIDFALLEKLPAPAAGAFVDVSILLAIVKFDRYEWALEKATELGANTIVPLVADRSEKALRQHLKIGWISMASEEE